MIRALVVVAVLACCSLARAELSAAGVAVALAEADHRYADLDYRGAAELAERIARDEQATVPQQTRAWERAGVAWLVLGQRALAKEALDHLFTLDPSHDIGDESLSPRQREFIDEIKAAHAPKPPVHEGPVEKPAVPVVVVPVVVVPVVVPVAAPQKKALWKRWYLWTPVVLGAAGLGFGLGFGLRPHAGPSGTLPPGTVDLK